MMPKPRDRAVRAAEATPMELAAAQTAARLQGVMPYLNDEIERMVRQIEMRACNAIRDAKLSPEMAVSLWMELHAARSLANRLGTKAIISAQSTEALTGGK